MKEEYRSNVITEPQQKFDLDLIHVWFWILNFHAVFAQAQLLLSIFVGILWNNFYDTWLRVAHLTLLLYLNFHVPNWCHWHFYLKRIIWSGIAFLHWMNESEHASWNVMRVSNVNDKTSFSGFHSHWHLEHAHHQFPPYYDSQCELLLLKNHLITYRGMVLRKKSTNLEKIENFCKMPDKII